MCESSKFIFVVPIQCVPFAAADDTSRNESNILLKLLLNLFFLFIFVIIVAKNGM